MRKLDFIVVYMYFTVLVFAKTYIMGKRYEAVLTCTNNLCFGMKEEKYLLFVHQKIVFFTAVKIALYFLVCQKIEMT